MASLDSYPCLRPSVGFLMAPSSIAINLGIQDIGCRECRYDPGRDIVDCSASNNKCSGALSSRIGIGEIETLVRDAFGRTLPCICCFQQPLLGPSTLWGPVAGACLPLVSIGVPNPPRALTQMPEILWVARCVICCPERDVAHIESG